MLPLLVVPALIMIQEPPQQKKVVDPWTHMGNTTAGNAIYLLLDPKYTNKTREGWWLCTFKNVATDGSFVIVYCRIDCRDNTWSVVSTNEYDQQGVRIRGMITNFNRDWEKFFPGTIVHNLSIGLEALEEIIRKQAKENKLKESSI